MQYLNSKERELLDGFAHTQAGEVILKLVKQNLADLKDINTINQDPIVSRQTAIRHLETNLLAYLEEKQKVEKPQVETYE